MTSKNTANNVTTAEPKAQAIKAKDFFADPNKIGLFMFAAHARLWSHLTEFGLVFPKNAPIYGVTSASNKNDIICDFKINSKFWYRIQAVAHHATVRISLVSINSQHSRLLTVPKPVKDNGNAGDLLFEAVLTLDSRWQHISDVVTSAVRDGSHDAVCFLQELSTFGLLTKSCLRSVWFDIRNEQRGITHKLKGFQGHEAKAQAEKEASKLWFVNSFGGYVEASKAFDTVYKSINFVHSI